jgi:hypothetical protein
MRTSADNLLPWAYPLVDCQPHLVDSGTPGRGFACRLYGEPDGQLPYFHGPSGGTDVHDQDIQLDHRR